MDNIGRKIYIIRMLYNYTQAYVADKLGISPTAYLSLEHNASKMPLSRLTNLLSLYGISVSDFFAFTESDLLNVIKNSGRLNKGMDVSEYYKIIAKLEAVNRILFRLSEHNIDKLKQTANE